MTTGEDGSYKGFARTGGDTRDAPGLSLRAMPVRIYSAAAGRVPEDAVDYALPTLELMRAGEVRGLVVGEHARPAVGAEVESSWDLDEGREGTSPHRLTVRTGPDGRFAVPGVPEGAEVALSARHRGLRTREPRLTRVGETSILHLAWSNGLALDGRVLDPAGRPIAGANVHLRLPAAHRSPEAR